MRCRQLWPRQFEAGEESERVLVVVTDGQDNASRLKFRELIEHAEEEDAVIYTVGMFGEMGRRFRIPETRYGR